MARSYVRTWPLLVGAVLLAGCQSYIPTQVAELPVGANVRVFLSRQAFADLPQISDRQGARLEGSLLRRTPDAVTLRIPISIGSQLGQEITVPANGIVQSDVRVVSKGKTALAAAAGVALVVTLIGSTRTGKPNVSGNPDDPDPGENEGFTARGARISPFVRLLSFSIPIH